MKKAVKHILTIYLSLISYAAIAQDFPSRIWHEGFLVTAKEDTVRGLLKYNMDTDIVQVVINKEQVKTFSSKKILYFEIYDEAVKNYRQFYSLPYQVRVDYKTLSLFEVLYEGPLTLLVKERIVTVTDPYSQSYYSGQTVTREKLDYTYFFINQKGKMEVFSSGKRSDLLAILRNDSEKVRDYIKQNRLRTDRLRDIVRITAFYNSL